MASNNGAEKALVQEWAKGQKAIEEAQAALKAAHKGNGAHAKAIYEAFGKAPFEVKSLGRKYRAVYKPERKTEAKDGKPSKTIPESWVVMPIAENEAQRSF